MTAHRAKVKSPGRHHSARFGRFCRPRCVGRDREGKARTPYPRHARSPCRRAPPRPDLSPNRKGSCGSRVRLVARRGACLLIRRSDGLVMPMTCARPSAAFGFVLIDHLQNLEPCCGFWVLRLSAPPAASIPTLRAGPAAPLGIIRSILLAMAGISAGLGFLWFPQRCENPRMRRGWPALTPWLRLHRHRWLKTHDASAALTMTRCSARMFAGTAAAGPPDLGYS
jgi:hypothetical protein